MLGIKKRFYIILVINIFCCIAFIYHYFFVSNTALYNVVSYAIPCLVFLSINTFIYCLFFGTKFLWLIPLITLVFSIEILKSIYAIHPFKIEEKSDFTVLTYNVGTFNLDRFHTADSVRIVDSIVILSQQNFFRTCNADIICIQEFFNNDAIRFEAFLDEMRKYGYHYFYTNPIKIEGYRGFFGVITFSKLPIVKTGTITFDYKKNKRALNRAIYTDIIIKTDTVRIINIHLQSMDLRLGRIANSITSDTLSDELNLLKEKFKYGFRKRGSQILKIEEEILKNQKKKIVCGDLNDLPFAFSYKTIKKYLNNSFEDAGNGFGFTYNKSPWFIRIDNQFYDKELQINYCKVISDNNHSDHFPVVAGYSLK